MSRGESAARDLFPQCLQGCRFGTHAEAGALFVGVLAKHFAGGEDLAAQLLGGPGQQEFASTRSRWKKVTMVCRSRATSSGRRALMTTQSG